MITGVPKINEANKLDHLLTFGRALIQTPATTALYHVLSARSPISHDSPSVGAAQFDSAPYVVAGGSATATRSRKAEAAIPQQPQRQAFPERGCFQGRGRTACEKTPAYGASPFGGVSSFQSCSSCGRTSAWRSGVKVIARSDHT
jgi:hypothetical protein